MGSSRQNEKLIEALTRSAEREMSEAELRKQKVSFILGTVGKANNATQERVEKVLARAEGKAVAG